MSVRLDTMFEYRKDYRDYCRWRADHRGWTGLGQGFRRRGARRDRRRSISRVGPLRQADLTAICPLWATPTVGYTRRMSAERIEPDSLVELDDRGRTNLRRFGGEPHARYLVSVRRDGAIVFRPAVAMTVQEAAMWREHPKLMNEIADHVSGGAPMPMVTLDADKL
jgi:hypothetical protein